jgi:hypothetical protein
MRAKSSAGEAGDIDAVELAVRTESFLGVGDIEQYEFGILRVDNLGNCELMPGVVDLKA